MCVFSPERLQVDKDAARRFINGALGSARAKTDPFNAADASPSGTHTRFENPQDADAGGADAEAEERDSEMEVVETAEEVKAKVAVTPAKVKAKRPKTDPFAGGHTHPRNTDQGEARILLTVYVSTGYDSPKPASASKKAKQPAAAAVAASPAPSSPASTASGSPALSKHQKKKQQAEKRKAGYTSKPAA